MVWKIDVGIDRKNFPEYNELIDELKKIPDVVIKLSDMDSLKQVLIGIYDPEGKYKKRAVIIYYYETGMVQFMISIATKELFTVIEERKASAENNEKAISLLVGFTRYALAKITKDVKYIKETAVSQDDITQIKPIYVEVDTLSEDEANDIILSLKLTVSCEIIQVYRFYVVYIYPQSARDVAGAIFCCSDQCYLYVTWETQEGTFFGGKRFVIYLKGKKPTKETIREVLMTRKDLLMDIERYIRETLEKGEGS